MREREAHQWAVSRSDGKVQPRSIKSATGVRTPVPLEDPAYERWEFLAGNALREMFYKPDHRLAGSDFFVEFPGNYEIYFEARAGKKDYYLYGHPSGDSYKAARDFVPHLFWLTTGSEDIKDCQCTLCKRSVAEHARANAPKRKTSKPATTKAASTAPSSNTTTPVPAPAVPVTSTAGPAAPAPSVPVVQQPSASPHPATSAHVPAPAPAAAVLSPAVSQAQSRPQAVSAQQPQPGSQPRQEIKPAAASSAAPVTPAPPQQQQQQHQQQHQQQQQQQHQQQHQQQQQRILPPVESVLFRDGEVVWFKNGASWRIGIIIRNVSANATAGVRAHCVIRPLAHAALVIPPTAKLEEEMRPFLAFSVPSVSNNLTAALGNKPIHEIDWEAQQQAMAAGDPHKKDMLGMEASKMAVLVIDGSYSTFNRQSVPEPTPTRTFYAGVFLGSERLTAGEAVRIRPSPGDPPSPKPYPNVMAIRAIFVETTAEGERLIFFGDVLRLEEVPLSQPPAIYPHNLPAAMVREKSFRDKVRAHAGVRHDWVPMPGNMNQNAMRLETDVRGRFYETEKLMSIIDPARLQESVGKGELVEVQQYLNNRTDKATTRTTNRSEALMGVLPGNELPLSFGPGIIED
ncbi:hypothetical protein Micbo1qcDRAFT_237437 [Microdochium bolleyi]|uniref:Cryptic loci regulator 2 N-terminal domain-containing protein n=1 Tax=Microdochium bolleyi TaxID=196109 RepID=A0A136IKV0_9PEZI|nr:hypothetical protein Micbo1qcDRAFT_237437 [Microdochium bolleyi]